MIARKFQDKNKVPFHYQNFIVSTGQTTHDGIVHPASSVQQSYTPTPSVASSCPKPGASGTGREHEKHADDGWTRRTTIPRILTAPCLHNEAASPPQKNDESADHDILHPVFAAIQRQLDQNVWWAHQAWGRTRCDCGRRAASGAGHTRPRRAGRGKRRHDPWILRVGRMEQAFGTETQAGVQANLGPHAGHTSRQQRSCLIPRILPNQAICDRGVHGGVQSSPEAHVGA